jgi:ATP-dependent helicase Lhr and Lhr-like helicase
MTLPTLGSDTTIAYDRLHPHIRRWIREQGWSELRDIQAQATAAILGGGNDVLIAAATAAGKTEAAFLPILPKSRIAQTQGSLSSMSVRSRR